MKRNFLNKLVLLMLALSAFACKTRKVASSTAAPATVQAPDKGASAKKEVIRNITSAELQFKTIAIKAKADLSLNDDKHDVNMNIRIRKNEAIWVSVTAFVGIEAARALITPDSIKILNRLQNEYIARPFSYIQQFTNRQIDFKAVQAIFTATAIPGTLSEQASYKTVNSQNEVSGMLGSLVYKLLFNTNNNLVQSDLEDSTSGKRLSVNYSDFQNLGGKSFPNTINLNSSANSRSIILSLKCNSVELNNNFDIPFSVPKRFTVKNR